MMMMMMTAVVVGRIQVLTDKLVKGGLGVNRNPPNNLSDGIVFGALD